MMLTERTPVPTSVLPAGEFRDHLRLGSGFPDDSVQDGLLEGCLRSAIAAIEARTGKALFRREFVLSVTAWRDLSRQTLPVAPAVRLVSVSIVDRHGANTLIDASRIVLERDAHRPRIASASLFLPSIPVGGAAEIVFEAGFASDWNELPDDLKRAVLLLAATYYEQRDESGGNSAGMPYGVSALIDRYRNVRLFGGA